MRARSSAPRAVSGRSEKTSNRTPVSRLSEGQYLVAVLVRLRYTHVVDDPETAMSELARRLRDLSRTTGTTVEVHHLEFRWRGVTTRGCAQEIRS